MAEPAHHFLSLKLATTNLYLTSRHDSLVIDPNSNETSTIAASELKFNLFGKCFEARNGPCFDVSWWLGTCRGSRTMGMIRNFSSMTSGVFSSPSCGCTSTPYKQLLAQAVTHWGLEVHLQYLLEHSIQSSHMYLRRWQSSPRQGSRRFDISTMKGGSSGKSKSILPEDALSCADLIRVSALVSWHAEK